MKLECLGAQLNSPSVNRDFTYWYHTFSSLLHHSTQANDTNKLDTLVTFTSSYKYIEEWNNYKTTLNILKGLYIKLNKEVFVISCISQMRTKGKRVDSQL